MSFFDGQKIWNKLINHVNKNDRKKYIRLNVFLPENPPALNNTDCINTLRKSVHILQSFRAYKEIFYILLVFTFYFELYNAFFQKGRYYCYKIIKYRLLGNVIVKLLT